MSSPEASDVSSDVLSTALEHNYSYEHDDLVNALRVKPYSQRITSIISWCLYSKSAKVQQQGANLISRIPAVMKICEEELMRQIRSLLIIAVIYYVH
ncbi:4398_t:CDS:2 [Entrophospora sp. SA101]|nr:4398_t:CDS:2 [Entrophospora sp. SA101]CAJ0829213.1 1746_t:CDS:2 [Entrophospora sp. SA101]CAJ0918131.1 1247_t:CDS:2 [Entrophospora sp. SA101]